MFFMTSDDESDYFRYDEMVEYIDLSYYGFYDLMENIERFIINFKFFGINDSDSDCSSISESD